MRQAEIRLFCFPYAGGNSYAYRNWGDHVAADIEIDPIELPGRGRRPGEPLIHSLPELARDGLGQIGARLHEPYALYGHSLGACVAYLVARQVLRQSLPPPLHLFVSGRNAPTVSRDDNDQRHLLPREQFVDMLREMGGSPEEILTDPELMDYFEPIIRADFRADAEFVHEDEPPLDVPITVMMSPDDGETTPAAVQEWQRVTTRKIALHQLSGGHFFIYDHTPEVGRILSTGLGRPLR